MNRMMRKAMQAERLRRDQERIRRSGEICRAINRARDRGYDEGRNASEIAKPMPAQLVRAIERAAVDMFACRLADRMEDALPPIIVQEVAQHVWREVQAGGSVMMPPAGSGFQIHGGFVRHVLDRMRRQRGDRIVQFDIAPMSVRLQIPAEDIEMMKGA